MFRTGNRRADGRALLVQIGRVADIADGTAQGTRAIKRSLRSTEDFDPIHIEEVRFGCAGISPRLPGVLRNQRYIVQIKPDRRTPGLRTDPSYRYIVLALHCTSSERDARRRARYVFNVRDVSLLDLGLTDRRYAIRHIFDRFRSALRRNDDLFESGRRG